MRRRNDRDIGKFAGREWPAGGWGRDETRLPVPARQRYWGYVKCGDWWPWWKACLKVRKRAKYWKEL